jgi:alpha-galactosidase
VADDLPCILHWGPDLGDLSGPDLVSTVELLHMPGPDEPIWPHSWASVLPRQTAGWLGRPGLRGSRRGRDWELTYTSVRHEVVRIDDSELLSSVATDALAGLEVTTELELLTTGLLRVRAHVRNLLDEPYEVTLLEPALPVPFDADELLDLAGGPTHERDVQRRPFDQGQWVREAWGGRPGHDFPTLLAAGQHGFGFRSGRVWGVHLAWSGNQTVSAERSYTGWRLLRGGELIAPGEICLGKGETYRSPWLCGSWGHGLDELSGRFHQQLRTRSSHPRRPRPVVMNTWEAVRFNFDQTRLLALAKTAADLGVERFVLDDGWFLRRRDDTRGLGDWTVDPDVFPDGLSPLVTTVQSLGMEFGLWVEPEMINLDSDLARAHPDWVLGTHAGPGLASRNQHALDLSNPDAWQHVFDRISALVAEHGIAALKWDHNRPLTGAGRGPDHTPAIHQQTLAVYRMMAALRQRHPALEIEACAGGGARLDLGILEYASRTWPSDTIDAHERHRIGRWTGLTLPLEMVGTHVGASPDHTTHRQHPLDYRVGTAFWGHLGIECDITAMSETDHDHLKTWVELYKKRRHLLHTGTLVHADRLNPTLQLDGVVAPDQSEALYRLSCLEHSTQFPPGRITLPGLHPATTYRITLDAPGTPGTWSSRPPWSGAPATAPGRFLDHVGIQAPQMDPDTLIIVHVAALRSSAGASLPVRQGVGAQES